MKRGIDCIYEQQDTIPQEESPSTVTLSQRQGEPSSQLPTSNVAPAPAPAMPQQIQEPDEPNVIASTYSMDISMSGVESHTPVSVAPESITETIATENRMNWILYSRIEKDLEPLDAFTQVEDVQVQPRSDDFQKKCYELYFLHFHHRWTIFHPSTYDPCNPNMLTASIVVIGAWLEGSCEAKEYAIKAHITLMDEIFIKLVCFPTQKLTSHLTE